jgi:hypothetical protein
MDCIDEAIAEVISAKLLKQVLETLKKQDESITMEKAESVIADYFENKMAARLESDRIFYLKLPSKLQKIIPDEDVYGMIQNAFTDAFWAGYQAGIQDLQELQRETDSNE